jgi:hypothetical protein
VVGHQAVLRCLYGYFLDLQSDDIPHLSVPLHTVIKLSPEAYGCREERFALDPDTPNNDAGGDVSTSESVGSASALVTFSCVLCTLRTQISQSMCNFTFLTVRARRRVVEQTRQDVVRRSVADG